MDTLRKSVQNGLISFVFIHHKASFYFSCRLPDQVFSIPFPAQVEVAKKSYHMTCKEEKLAATREANSKGEASTPAEQKKLQEKLEKCKQDSQKVRTYTGMTL